MYGPCMLFESASQSQPTFWKEKKKNSCNALFWGMVVCCRREGEVVKLKIVEGGCRVLLLLQTRGWGKRRCIKWNKTATSVRIGKVLVKIINEQVNAIQSFHAWTSVVTSESILYLATNSKFYFAYISGVANGLEVGTIQNLTSPPQTHHSFEFQCISLLFFFPWFFFFLSRCMVNEDCFLIHFRDCYIYKL